jgi:hypothetical protein
VETVQLFPSPGRHVQVSLMLATILLGGTSTCSKPLANRPRPEDLPARFSIHKESIANEAV